MTIYADILKTGDSLSSNEKLTKTMVLKLENLFKVCFGIDLLHSAETFEEYSYIDSGMITIGFKFPYGLTTVILHPESSKMSVSFHLNGKIDLIHSYKSNFCHVNIDLDMNFIDLKFEYEVNFFKDMTNPYNSKSCKLILVTSKDNKLVTSRSFQYANSSSNLRTSMEHFKLEPQFLEFEDIAFINTFIDFISNCSIHPDSFYSQFENYPKHTNLVYSVGDMVYFCNLFHKEYVENVTLLKSKLLLSEMSCI
jgi:hypothetical protein